MAPNNNKPKDSAKTPFLQGELNDQDDNRDSFSDFESTKAQLRKRSWFKRHRNAVVIHTLMVAMNIAMAFMLWQRTWHRDRRLLYTPAQEYTRHTVQVVYDAPSAIKKSPYVGKPSPEIDAAWDHLLRHHNLRLTGEEMERMNITSIAFSRGGGYHGMMGVFHELHCLRLVREATLQDYYYKGISEGQRAYLAGHTDHCIEILRSAAMCRADTMIFPYHWADANRVPNPTWNQRHECVDWERLTEFLEPRKVDIHGPNVLVHPKYGPTYPGGKKIEEPNGPKKYPLDPE